MERIDVIVRCQNCGVENLLKISKGKAQTPTCKACRSTLVHYVPVNGYIYLLSNRMMSANLLKIGFTMRSVEERIAELNAETGVPAPFHLEAYFLSTEPELDEQRI